MLLESWGVSTVFELELYSNTTFELELYFSATFELQLYLNRYCTRIRAEFEYYPGIVVVFECYI